MRIRKRFPLSSLPFSDPQLNRSPAPVVQQHSHPEANPCSLRRQTISTDDSQPSDPPNQTPPVIIGAEKPRWLLFPISDNNKELKHKEMDGEEVRKHSLGELEEKSTNNDSRKGSILGAEVGREILPPSASYPHQEEVGRWSERDKFVPLKKRRESLERIHDEIKEITTATKKKKTMKKTNWVQQDDDDYEPLDEDHEIQDNNGKKKKKKKKSGGSSSKRGNVIMEGSRCSRVNGRGWRCCQQTLVGYSLCEHHLGKGRLRTMSSVRSRPSFPSGRVSTTSKNEINLHHSVAVPDNNHDQELLLSDDDDEDDDDEEEEETLMMAKKKRVKKLGVVKARSISSLLGQSPKNIGGFVGDCSSTGHDHHVDE